MPISSTPPKMAIPSFPGDLCSFESRTEVAAGAMGLLGPYEMNFETNDLRLGTKSTHCYGNVKIVKQVNRCVEIGGEDKCAVSDGKFHKRTHPDPRTGDYAHVSHKLAGFLMAGKLPPEGRTESRRPERQSNANAGSGSSLWAPHLIEIAGVHRRRGADAGFGDRCEHRDLQHREQRFAASPAFPPSLSVGSS